MAWTLSGIPMTLEDAKLQASLKQRYNFAVQHMIAAARFSRHCFDVENIHLDHVFGPFFSEVLSYVSGAVLSSVAGLEANINELFADIQDEIIVIDGFDTKLLENSWTDIEKLSILEKYEKFFEMAKSEKFDRSGREYQFVKILITVRNALVHYKPEWHAEKKEHFKISQQLKGKFKLSPFLDDNAPVFPMRCMTHNFAEWAVLSVLEFADWYATSLNIQNRFNRHTNHFSTKPPSE